MIVPDKTIGCHSQPVMAVRFSPCDTYLAVTGGNRTVCIYDTVSHFYFIYIFQRIQPYNITFQKSVHAYQKLNHHERHVGGCSFSRNGTLLATGSNDKTVAIWDMGNGEDLSGNL